MKNSYKYVIMCGGEYEKFKTPKHLSVINGERIVDRTIRLLKENGIEDIVITSNNPMFDSCGVPRLEHTNTYKQINGKQEGYWLDAYYPFDDEQKVCYLYGDVYYSEQAIKTIINYDNKKITLFGTSAAKNKYHNNWGEPFGFKVNDNKRFKNAIKEVKILQDKGRVKRMPVTWELYRYLNGTDINVQKVFEDTYICIDDETMDIDYPDDIKQMNDKLKGSE